MREGARTDQARRLRQDCTLAEAVLWRRLRNRGLEMLVVEVDGSQHGPARDARRTAFLKSEGFAVLRFWNNDVLTNLEGVLLRIEEALTRNR